MIAAIKGKTYGLREQSIIIACDSGLFYEVFLSDPDLKKLRVGEVALLLTWVKKDKETLEETMYGFTSEDQRKMFMDLLSVNGVGPKTAMTALGFTLDSIRENIGKGNYQFFQLLKGVGFKTAKRIILELQKKYWGDNQNE